MVNLEELTMNMDKSKEEVNSIHELVHKANSSLAIISGYLQLLNQKAELKEEEKKWMEKLTAECKKLEELLESYSETTR